jgi:spore germination protein GerM
MRGLELQKSRVAEKHVMGGKRLILFLVIAIAAAGVVFYLFEVYSGKVVVSLYFADADNAFLKPERIKISSSSDPAKLGKAVMEFLIKGPAGGLGRTIPEETSVRSFKVEKNGTAHADFTSAIRDKHPGGSSSELMTVYSIVNSLTMNIPEIKRVKILIEGREQTTLAGHVDLRFPLKADTALVK